MVLMSSFYLMFWFGMVYDRHKAKLKSGQDQWIRFMQSAH